MLSTHITVNFGLILCVILRRKLKPELQIRADNRDNADIIFVFSHWKCMWTLIITVSARPANKGYNICFYAEIQDIIPVSLLIWGSDVTCWPWNKYKYEYKIRTCILGLASFEVNSSEKWVLSWKNLWKGKGQPSRHMTSSWHQYDIISTACSHQEDWLPNMHSPHNGRLQTPILKGSISV